jgi:O-antigen/teichoic acid export membrane protein
MANIRKQSIKGTLWVYFGFGIGALITYLFTHKSWFSTNEYGLTRSILEIGILVAAFANIGCNFYLYKFFPYYKDNLPNKQNDLLGLALKIALIGFLLTCTGIYFLQPIINKKFATNAPLLMEYFYLLIPVGFFYLLNNILESYAYGFAKAVTISFLKEVAIRLYTLVLVVLKVFSIINLKVFISLFAFQYAILTICLGYILYKENSLWINFTTSKLTKRFKKNIINILLLTYLTIVVTTLRTSIDSMVLAAKKDLGNVAVFGFVTYLIMAIQAPIRTLANVTVPILSRCWKEKNLIEINRIYKRTSINLLAFSLFAFCLILLNYENAIIFFNLNTDYLVGKTVFILLGLVTIIELGTGVNGQIIGTSTFYRFELWTSILLTALIIPLSYFLTDKYGIIGPALGNLISFGVYNTLRILFLYKKFKMIPFSIKTLELLLITAISFVGSYFINLHFSGLLAMLISSLIFISSFGYLFYGRNISPDTKQVFETIKNRFKK